MKSNVVGCGVLRDFPGMGHVDMRGQTARVPTYSPYDALAISPAFRIEREGLHCDIAM